MAGKHDCKTIAFLATEGVEQAELTDPWEAVLQAGETAELISLEAGVGDPSGQGQAVVRATRSRDQLVGALAGAEFERAHGDEVRALEGDL